MNSEWKIGLRPDSPRTLVPITVEVTGSGAPSAVVTVRSPRDGRSFRVDTASSSPESVRGMFWLQRAGDYEVTAEGAGGTIAVPLKVSEQVFLTFPAEFGLFALTFCIAAGGLISWFRIKKRAGSTLPSLRS